jgi:integrase
MGIRKREGFWHFRIMIGGREFTGNTGLEATERNRKAAIEFGERRRRELKQELALQKGFAVASLDFATAAGKFLRHIRDVRHRGKPATAQRIKVSFSSLVWFFGEYAIAAVDAAAIDSYKALRLTEHRVKEITLRHDLHALSLFFQYAQRQGWCGRNPVRDVEIPSDMAAVRDNVLTDAQLAKYFAAAALAVDKYGRRNLHDLAKIILNQGMRPEEVMSARKSALDVKARRLTVNAGKTRAAQREVYLSDESVEILKARLATPGPWLFPSGRYGDARHITKLAGSHDRACEAAGVAFVLYDLRHTYATRMVALGTDTITLASMMGHANLRTILRYAHPQAEEKRRAQQRYEAAMKRTLLKVVG